MPARRTQDRDLSITPSGRTVERQIRFPDGDTES
jgi:hypothetical protein